MGPPNGYFATVHPSFNYICQGALQANTRCVEPQESAHQNHRFL